MAPPRTLVSLLPGVVGATALALTGWLWAHEQATTQRTLRADFDFSVRQTASRIEQRMASYEQMLRGVQGLFRASGRVDRDAFDTYVDALLAGADFAGVRSLAYLAQSPAGRGAAVLTFVAPAGEAQRRAIGDEAYAEPACRAAMDLARDSGGIGITPNVPRLIDPEHGAQPGFLMFLPVYGPGRAVGSVVQRRVALDGWVVASVRMGDLMSSLYGEGTPGIDVRVDDGVSRDGGSLMYASAPALADARPALFEAREYIGYAGHSWTLGVSARPEFEQRHGRDSAPIIAGAGVALSLLLALLARQWLQGRARAHAVARAMTAELRASEERYRLIVETADEGIWVTDADGRATFVNPKMAQMLGCRGDEVLGCRLTEFEDGPPAGPETTAAPGEAVRREHRLRRQDGAELWVSVASGPLRAAAGGPGGALAMVTDITERKRAEGERGRLELQLRESQKMEAIGTLAGGIAHDFNNILAAILGNVALAQAQGGEGAPAPGPLEQIQKAALRARGLVQQILAFSRREPHVLQVQPLRPVVEEAVSLLRPLLPALVQLELVLTGAPLHVAADATQLQQVVLNLCTNAWHALQGRAGRITVGLEAVDRVAGSTLLRGRLPHGPCAHLWVADTGCGMDAATLARVFDPFFTTKPVGQGTGLGLSVVHGIVAAHAGAMAVASTPGQGSRFDLYFPLRAPQPAVAAPAGPPPAASQGQHVVYVDDDPTLCLLVQGLLQRAGYRVSCYEDPRAALDALRAEPGGCDLVVTDYNMPGLSGLDVASELARLRPELPVVISSGYLTEEIAAAATQAGVRGLLQKEYTLERLEALVQRVLAESRGAAAAAHPEPAMALPLTK
jgi:PAS domain S-box-containing protein